MNSSVTPTPKRAAGFFGAVFAFVFLIMYDSDAMPPGMLGASQWLVLLPAAFLLALRPSHNVWSSGLTLAGGIFVWMRSRSATGRHSSSIAASAFGACSLRSACCPGRRSRCRSREAGTVIVCAAM